MHSGLESLLGNSDQIETNDESIIEISTEIKKQLIPAHRGNPYALIDGVMQWIKDNIRPTPLPCLRFLLAFLTSATLPLLTYLRNYFWIGKTSAKKTLEEKSGKCDGISNLFLIIISDKNIDAILGLLEKDRTFVNSLLGREKHKSEIEFLKSLRKV